MIDHVLFDLDGTLIHSAPGILGSFTRVITAAGRTPVDAIDTRVIGPPLLATMKRLTGLHDGPELDGLLAAFRTEYDSAGVLQAEPYPALDEVLDALRAANRKSYIVTNKRHLPAQLIAARLGMAPRLSGLYSLDSFTPPAPRKQAVVAHVMMSHEITADRTILVGDSVEDAQAAHANGIPFIAVRYGYGDPLAYGDARPAAELRALAELPALLARLD